MVVEFRISLLSGHKRWNGIIYGESICLASVFTHRTDGHGGGDSDALENYTSSDLISMVVCIKDI